MWANILEHKRTLLILAVIILGLGFITYQVVSVSGIFSDLKNDLKTIEPEEENAYKDIYGNPVYLSDYKGKILVVNSWASWSPYSKSEFEILEEVQKEYGDELSVIAINRKETIAKINAYLQAFDIDQDTLLFLFDPTDHFYSAIGGYAMPETVVYAQDGTIYLHVRGTLKKEVLNEAIMDLRK